MTPIAKKITLALALAFAISTAQADSSRIAYQGVAFNDGIAVASTNIALRFTVLQSDGATVVYQETQAGVATTDKGFFSHQIGSGTRTDGANTYAEIAWADGYKLKVEVDYANGTAYTDLGVQDFSSSVYALSATTLTGLTSTVAELNYVDGVTSAIQTQLDGKEPSFTKNTGFNRNFGTATNTVIHGNDARLSNARTPLSHTHGQISNTGAITSGAVAPASTDYLILSDASGGNVLRRGVLIGTGTTTYLRNDGAWGTPPNTNTTYSAGTGLSLSGTTFTNSAPHIATNLTMGGTAALPQIRSSTGIDVLLPHASDTQAGLVSTTAQSFAGNKTFNNNVILPLGRIGLGILNPSYPLHIVGGADRNFSYGYLNNSGGTGSSTANRALSIYTTTAIAGLNIYAHSDNRIKEDIQPIGNALSLINELEPMSYTMIDKVAHGSGVSYGFIAQDLEAVIPEAVTKSYGELPVLKLFDEVVFEEGVTYTLQVRNAEDETRQEYTTGQQRPEGEVFVINKKVDDFRTVDYNMVFTQAVAAIKEQQVLIEAQQKLIEAMQHELEQIKKELRATDQTNR